LSQEDKKECNLVVFENWFAAATQGRIDNIKKLLKRGFKVNRKMNFEGTVGDTTALYCAANGYVCLVWPT